MGDLSRELLTFLLETSLLGEFDAAACEMVCQRADVGQLLEEARRRRLLEMEMTEEPGGGVRVRHQDWLADFLRRELALRTPRQRLVELHHRAASVSPRGQAIELLLGKLRETKSNFEFLVQVQKTTPVAVGHSDDDEL